MIIGVLSRYGKYLPVTPSTPIFTLGEGDTPLVQSKHIGKQMGCDQLYFKLEGCNPTGSFKDRGMIVAVAKAVEEGSKAIICASTGNTSASAAAYGASQGLKTIVIVPRGNIAQGKLAQAMMYGAAIVAVDGNFDVALEVVRSLVKRNPVTLVNSLNPYRIEGQKTAAFEVVDDLGRAPDCLCIPVGNAGNITAYWKGFKEYKALGKSSTLPKMMGFEAAGAAPIVLNRIVKEPKTIATAIKIGNPASWEKAVAARDESGGLIDTVTDDDIATAYKLLAGKEGVFGEPASAASVAGLLKLKAKGLDFAGKTVVCVITGSGLKDPQIAIELSKPPTDLPADVSAIEKFLGW